MSSDETLIAIGRVTKIFGLRGEFRIEPLTDFVERFDSLSEVFIELRNGQTEKYVVQYTKIEDSSVLIKLKGIDDRTAAESFKGATVEIKKDDLYKLGEDAFYYFDIEGMEALDEEGNILGIIFRVDRYPANDVLLLDNKEKIIVVPAVKEFVKNIDIDNKKIYLKLQEGLPEYSRDDI